MKALSHIYLTEAYKSPPTFIDTIKQMRMRKRRRLTNIWVILNVEGVF